MLTADQLAEFTAIAFSRLEMHVAERDPMIPRAFGARLDQGRLVLNGDASLEDEAFGQPERIPRVIGGLLAMPDMEVVAVAHEAWARKLPGMPSDQIQQAMGHLSWNAEDKAEVVIFAIHGHDFQTAVLHAIWRVNGMRQLRMGPLSFDTLTLGGAMARDMPTRH